MESADAVMVGFIEFQKIVSHNSNLSGVQAVEHIPWISHLDELMVVLFVDCTEELIM